MTQRRSVYGISDSLWRRAKAAAAEQGASLSEWIGEAIQKKLSKETSMFKNLDELHNAMKNHDPRVMDSQHPHQWSTDLPTFGGREPANTMEVWSWDEKRLLVGSCAEDLEIVERGDFRGSEHD